MSTLQPFPQPLTLERWVGEGGWLVDLLLPSTDPGVAGQALIVMVMCALPFRPARRLGIVQPWAPPSSRPDCLSCAARTESA